MTENGQEPGIITLSISLNIMESLTKYRKMLFPAHSIGQYTADSQNGITKVPRTLLSLIYLTSRGISSTGGTSKLFSHSQFCEKASTASESGQKNLELNRGSFLF